MTIINNAVNDVAITVLPDAPIDPTTGMQVPTIAVATDGGVSVIKDDGTVVDIPTAGVTTKWVDFNSTGKLVSHGNYDDRWVLREIPDTDIANLESAGTYIANPYREFGTGADYQKMVIVASHEYIADLGNSRHALYRSRGGEAALETSPLTLLTTSTYLSGWMPGDIRGAWLADTTAETITGADLVTNGTFDTDVSGWTGSNATLALGTNNMVVTVTANGAAYAYQAITTVAGKTYTVTANLVSEASSDNSAIYVGTSAGAADIASTTATSTAGVQQVTFTATGTTTYISLYTGAGALASETVTWDDVSCRLADSDRSVKNNGLQVFGSLTKAAVAIGAELVAYSGFSASNYLEQPYNADLDFGTGDFCVMGWVKTSLTAGTQSIYIWQNATGTSGYGGNVLRACVVGNTGYFYVVAGTYSLSTTKVVADNMWHHVAFSRTGGVYYLFVDGALDTSLVRAADDLTTTDAVSKIGNIRYNTTDGVDAFVGSLALLRIGATAPSAEQIRHIYQTEKALFQDNAKCTLYGTSDVVAALAHDPATGLLHVGTSAGRSTFNGLRRVANTTTGITTAISARNDMIVEA